MSAVVRGRVWSWAGPLTYVVRVVVHDGGWEAQSGGAARSVQSKDHEEGGVSSLAARGTASICAVSCKGIRAWVQRNAKSKGVSKSAQRTVPSAQMLRPVSSDCWNGCDAAWQWQTGWLWWMDEVVVGCLLLPLGENTMCARRRVEESVVFFFKRRLPRPSAAEQVETVSAQLVPLSGCFCTQTRSPGPLPLYVGGGLFELGEDTQKPREGGWGTGVFL